MTTYTIKKGAVNAKPNKSRLRFVRSGAAWRVRFKLDRPPVGLHLSSDSIEYVGPTHIKLLGLYWSGWMVWQRMREAWKAKKKAYEGHVSEGYVWGQCLRAALRQYLAWTHGNSARVIAKWGERDVGIDFGSESTIKQRGVALSTYYYLQGRGAVTTGSPVAGQEIAWLPEDPDNPGWTVRGEVPMKYVMGNLWIGQEVLTEQRIPLSRRPWFFGLCKPHAANGPSSPHAPCDLTFEMERL